MKFVTSLSMIFMFCFCLLANFSHAQSAIETPFVKQYREKYYANNANQPYIVMGFGYKCQRDCGIKDKKAIESLAKSGDMATLAILPFISLGSGDFKKFDELLEENASQGELTATLLMYTKNRKKDRQKAFNYALVAKNKGNIAGYNNLSNWYLNEGDTKMFCSVRKEAFKLFGFESLVSILAQSNSEDSKVFFNSCTKKTRKELINMAGSEGKLIEGYSMIVNKEYANAAKIFEQLYSSDKNIKVSANAGYCLGMLNYYGKGVAENKSLGTKLLKEALENGIYYLTKPHAKDHELPQKTLIISYFTFYCSSLDTDIDYR